jgi:hypothetical protein
VIRKDAIDIPLLHFLQILVLRGDLFRLDDERQRIFQRIPRQQNAISRQIKDQADYVQDSVGKGWVSVWWAYREAHAANLAVVAKAYKSRALPDLPVTSAPGVQHATP